MTSEKHEDALGCPYLLALNVGLVENDGRYWADASWAKDLLRHLDCIERLTLVCPVERRVPDKGWKELPGDRLRVMGYYAPRSGRQFVIQLPRLIPLLWHEVGAAEIVHSGVAGWPIPLGWLTTPMARLRGRKVVLIVESAFWRAPSGAKSSVLKKLKSAFWEAAARACLRQADYAAYTQPDYKRTLPAPRANGGVLIQASWIDAGDCLTDSDAEARWVSKMAAPRRFLFASRMIAPKGTAVMAAAIELLAAAEADVRIDILGDGPQRGDFSAALSSTWARAHVRLLDPIPYNARFLMMLRDYHAILVPSLSDEQPRIVYDGYAQAVPTIASDLPGLRACVQEGMTGRFFPAGDARALADCLVSTDGVSLRAQGLAGLKIARDSTHEALHADRLRALNRLLNLATD